MGKLYSFLGLSVGVVLSGMNPNERKDAYAADITYGTNNEFGFDYLRDNMAFSADQRVQREFVYAVVDEVDSILIDEARTPLIISGPTDDRSDVYAKIEQIVPKLSRQVGEVEEGEDIRVPRLEIHGEGALPLAAALVDEARSVVVHAQHGQQPVGLAVGAADVAAARADVGDAQADAARRL